MSNQSNQTVDDIFVDAASEDNMTIASSKPSQAKLLDARRRLEDRLEEARLRKDMDEFDFDY